MENFDFASRTDWPQGSNALNQALDNLKLKQISVLDLTASNPTTCAFDYPKEILAALTHPANLQYVPEANGMAHARRAVAAYYAQKNVVFDPTDIVLTASTSEAYAFLLRLLVNPGERVLIPRPSYPLFQFLLEINDVAFDYYSLAYDGYWHVDTHALEQMVTPKTKAIILVNPNNPTGSYIHKQEMDFLNKLCRKHQMAIIADEVFLDYAWDKVDAVSCMGNQDVLTFVLSGLSKTLALPQMKCAWILASGPQAVLKQAMARLEIIADTYLSVNTPVQNALESWLKCVPNLQWQITQRVLHNWIWLAGHMNKHAQLLFVQGGWYAILRLPAVTSEEEWVLEFLNNDHVLVHPGYFFDFNQGAHIVLSLLPPPEVFQEAAGRILQKVGKISN